MLNVTQRPAGGKRLFLPVGYLTPKINLPTTADSLRRSPFQADSRGYTDETEISVALPEGYHIESVPEPIHYNEAFGSYQLSISADAPGQIFIRR